jgi:hypothetical protein
MAAVGEVNRVFYEGSIDCHWVYKFTNAALQRSIKPKAYHYVSPASSVSVTTRNQSQQQAVNR